jgi:hypothetical protein
MSDEGKQFSKPELAKRKTNFTRRSYLIKTVSREVGLNSTSHGKYTLR